MFEFLKIQYQLGKLSEESLHRYVKAGRITESQYREIIGKEKI